MKLRPLRYLHKSEKIQSSQGSEYKTSVPTTAYKTTEGAISVLQGVFKDCQNIFIPKRKCFYNITSSVPLLAAELFMKLRLKQKHRLENNTVKFTVIVTLLSTTTNYVYYDFCILQFKIYLFLHW